MLHDFTMITKRFEKRPTIKVYGIADVHLGSLEHMEGAWEAFRKRVLQDPNSYIILAGDLINNNIRTSVGSPFEATMRPRQQKKIMIEQLAPLRDRILCMVGGNHERRTSKDTDESPSYDIACKLDLEDVYRETAAFLKIQMGDSKGNGLINPCYTFCVTHGAGGSIYTTNAAMRAERFGMAIDGMDMLIVGHIHKPQDFPVFKYVIDKYNNKVSVKPFNVFVCTSWTENGAYGLQSLMQPTGHSLAHFTLNGTKKEITFSRKSEY